MKSNGVPASEAAISVSRRLRVAKKKIPLFVVFTICWLVKDYRNVQVYKDRLKEDASVSSVAVPVPDGNLSLPMSISEEASGMDNRDKNILNLQRKEIVQVNATQQNSTLFLERKSVQTNATTHNSTPLLERKSVQANLTQQNSMLKKNMDEIQNKSVQLIESRQNSTQQKKRHIMYILTLDGVEGARESNIGRLASFHEHWGILCPDIDIDFRVCPGELGHRGWPVGFPVTLAFRKCFQKALDESSFNKEAVFTFFEDDARLYSPEFCDIKYRERLYAAVPNDTSFLFLGGHGMVQDHKRGTELMMTGQGLPNFWSAKTGAGFYGFTLMNVGSLIYFRDRLDKMLNKTWESIKAPGSVRGFAPIDRQVWWFPRDEFRILISTPWLVYHEGGHFSNTKGKIRGEFGGGSQQYRWINGLTGSFKNCSLETAMQQSGEQDEKIPGIDQGLVTVACNSLLYRIPSNLQAKMTQSKIIVGVLSDFQNNIKRRMVIRNTWAQNNTGVVFLVGGKWEDIRDELMRYNDTIWIDINETQESKTVLKTASFISLAEDLATKGHFDYKHLLKVTDLSEVMVHGVMSRLDELGRNGTRPDKWGSICGTGTRPVHIGVPKEEYSDYFFPEYCKGEVFALSRDFVQCAVKHIPSTKYVRADGAFVGILGERCGITKFSGEAEDKIYNDTLVKFRRCGRRGQLC